MDSSKYIYLKKFVQTSDQILVSDPSHYLVGIDFKRNDSRMAPKEINDVKKGKWHTWVKNILHNKIHCFAELIAICPLEKIKSKKDLSFYENNLWKFDWDELT